MKKLILITLLLGALPFVASAKPTDNYVETMQAKLSFSLNKDQQIYDQSIEQVRLLNEAGQPIVPLNQKLLEVKTLLERASTSIIALDGGNKPWRELRQEVRKIITDLRLAHAKIKVINRLIANYGK